MCGGWQYFGYLFKYLLYILKTGVPNTVPLGLDQWSLTETWLLLAGRVTGQQALSHHVTSYPKEETRDWSAANTNY